MLKSVRDPDIVDAQTAAVEPPRRGGAVIAIRALLQIVLMVAVLFGSYVIMERMIAAAPSRRPRQGSSNGKTWPQFRQTMWLWPIPGLGVST